MVNTVRALREGPLHEIWQTPVTARYLNYEAKNIKCPYQKGVNESQDARSLFTRLVRNENPNALDEAYGRNGDRCFSGAFITLYHFMKTAVCLTSIATAHE